MRRQRQPTGALRGGATLALAFAILPACAHRASTSGLAASPPHHRSAGADRASGNRTGTLLQAILDHPRTEPLLAELDVGEPVTLWVGPLARPSTHILGPASVDGIAVVRAASEERATLAIDLIQVTMPRAMIELRTHTTRAAYSVEHDGIRWRLLSVQQVPIDPTATPDP